MFHNVNIAFKRTQKSDKESPEPGSDSREVLTFQSNKLMTANGISNAQ
jgi:hypothetical protein